MATKTKERIYFFIKELCIFAVILAVIYGSDYLLFRRYAGDHLLLARVLSPLAGIIEVFLIFTFVFKKRFKESFWKTNFPENGRNLTDVGFVVAVFLLLWALNIVLMVSSGHFNISGWAGAGLAMDRYLIVTSFAYYRWVAVGIVEEALCRGYFQNALARTLKKKRALVLAAAVFAALHLAQLFSGVSAVNVLTLTIPNAYLYGLVLGYVYTRTKSLAMPIAMHSLANFLKLPLIFPAMPPGAGPVVNGGSIGPKIMAQGSQVFESLILAVLFYVAIFLILRAYLDSRGYNKF